jgi:hypothetical protein
VFFTVAVCNHCHVMLLPWTLSFNHPSSCHDEQVGGTALMMAAENGHLEVVLRLLEKGADIQAKDRVSYALFIFPSSNTGLIHDVVAGIESHCCMAIHVVLGKIKSSLMLR